MKKKGFSIRVTGKVVRGIVCLVFTSSKGRTYAISLKGGELVAAW